MCTWSAHTHLAYSHVVLRNPIHAWYHGSSLQHAGEPACWPACCNSIVLNITDQHAGEHADQHYLQPLWIFLIFVWKDNQELIYASGKFDASENGGCCGWHGSYGCSCYFFRQFSSMALVSSRVPQNCIFLYQLYELFDYPHLTESFYSNEEF